MYWTHFDFRVRYFLLTLKKLTRHGAAIVYSKFIIVWSLLFDADIRYVENSLDGRILPRRRTLGSESKIVVLASFMWV